MCDKLEQDRRWSYSPPDDPAGSAVAGPQVPPARCQEYDDPNTEIAFPAPSIAVATELEDAEASTVAALQVPPGDRVAASVRVVCDHTRDACPASSSATFGAESLL